MLLLTLNINSQVLLQEEKLEVGTHILDQNSLYSGINVGYQNNSSLFRLIFSKSLEDNADEQNLITLHFASRIYSKESFHLISDASLWFSENYDGRSASVNVAYSILTKSASNTCYFEDKTYNGFMPFFGIAHGSDSKYEVRDGFSWQEK